MGWSGRRKDRVGLDPWGWQGKAGEGGQGVVRRGVAELPN